MKTTRFALLSLALLAIALILPSACKSSGMAVTSRGQLLKINIDAPTDMSDNDTKELLVTISNVGVNQIKNVEFDVEMPNELIVQSQVPGRGIEMTEAMSSAGTKLFHYRAGNISVGTSSEVNFHVRAAFGSLQRTGDIKVTAWAEDLPNNKLVETKFIKLRQ